MSFFAENASTSRFRLTLPVILLLVILCTTLFLRLYALSSYPPALFSDEAVNGVNTLQALETHQFKIFYPENNGREGLFINIQAFFVWLFGPEAWALRFASVLFGTLTVLGLYFLTKELLGANNELRIMNNTSENLNSASLLHNSLFTIHTSNIIALSATFFLAVSFWHVNFSRIGFRAITAPFWGVWAFYFFFVARKQLLSAERASLNYLPWSLLSGAVFGLGFHSYIAFRVMPAVLLFLLGYMLMEAKRGAYLKKFFIFAGIMILGAVITASPLLVHFLNSPQDIFGRTSNLSIFGDPNPIQELLGNIIKTLGMFNVVGDFNPRHNIPGQSELTLLPGLLFLIGLYVAGREVVKQIYNYIFSHALVPAAEAIPGLAYSFPLLWLLVASLPVVISNEGVPHALRSILMIPPVFILAGLGATHIYSWLRQKLEAHDLFTRHGQIIKISMSLIAILLFIQTFIAYFYVWGRDSKTKEAFSFDYNERAYELRALPQELNKYVIYNSGDTGINVVQFLTDTATPILQAEHNLHYITRDEVKPSPTPAGAYITELK